MGVVSKFTRDIDSQLDKEMANTIGLPSKKRKKKKGGKKKSRCKRR